MHIRKISLLAVAAMAIAAASCSHNDAEPQLTKSGLDPANFVAEVDGKTTALYTLTNANGMEVCLTNFGGRIVSVMVPDRQGDFKDVVIAFDSIADYLTKASDFGATIGRYANRINRGRFELDGVEYQLPVNNVENPAYAADTIGEKPFLHHLHGGPTGWQYKVFDVIEQSDSTITMQIDSPDGDNDFPGNVVATVKFTLTADNAIDIDYTAVTDKPTIINMTNHSYFNLNGDANTPITNCTLQLNASQFTPVDSTFMTTGEIATVKETPFDFTEPAVIGELITVENEQIKNGNGFDHNWVLDTAGDDTQVAATLSSPVTGITLTVYTNEPGVQVYTGNFLDGSAKGKHGASFGFRHAVCLETQHYPDAPNKPNWPSVVLRPGETYKSHCVYKFGVQE